MEFVHDRAEVPKNEGEAAKLDAREDDAWSKESQKYEDLVHNPWKLHQLVQFGYDVKAAEGAHGMDSLEIRDKNGNVVFYENMKSLRELEERLAAEEPKLEGTL